jgi:hypothetical protein
LYRHWSQLISCCSTFPTPSRSLPLSLTHSLSLSLSLSLALSSPFSLESQGAKFAYTASRLNRCRTAAVNLQFNNKYHKLLVYYLLTPFHTLSRSCALGIETQMRVSRPRGAVKALNPCFPAPRARTSFDSPVGPEGLVPGILRDPILLIAKKQRTLSSQRLFWTPRRSSSRASIFKTPLL